MPDSFIYLPVSLFRWQPSQSFFQAGVKISCKAAKEADSVLTCSNRIILPPFLQTDLASPGENAMPEQIPPSLPQSGPEGDEPSEKSFPLMLIFAFLILGGSAYLAFFTHDPAQKI